MRPSGVGFRTRVLPPNTEAPAEDLVSQVVVQFKSAAGEAVAALVAIVRDPEAPASARVSGARTILEFTGRAVEIVDLHVRIQKLEQEAAARAAQPIRAAS